MSRWSPTNICSGGPATSQTCVIEFDDLTGECLSFSAKCSRHAAMASLSDDDLIKQIKYDSLHWANAVITLRDRFPGIEARLLFDDSGLITVEAKDCDAATVADIQSTITADIDGSQSMGQLASEIEASSGESPAETSIAVVGV